VKLKLMSTINEYLRIDLFKIEVFKLNKFINYTISIKFAHPNYSAIITK
jgi:hypothetical protein